MSATNRNSDHVRPRARRERFVSKFGLSDYEAEVLTQSKEMADFYEDIVQVLGGGQKLAASWTIGEFSAALNRAGLEFPINRRARHRTFPWFFRLKRFPG